MSRGQATVVAIRTASACLPRVYAIRQFGGIGLAVAQREVGLQQTVRRVNRLGQALPELPCGEGLRMLAISVFHIIFCTC